MPDVRPGRSRSTSRPRACSTAWRERRAAERLALLEYLAADGVPLLELQRTTASGTIMFLPAERVVGGRVRYSAARSPSDGDRARVPDARSGARWA